MLSSTAAKKAMPALLTRTSMVPARPMTCWTPAVTASGSVTSMGRMSTLRCSAAEAWASPSAETRGADGGEYVVAGSGELEGGEQTEARGCTR